MLQQTRVEAMLEKYKKFMIRFPDLETLAKAEEEDVLAAWQGLGYYSRAKNLHRASRLIRSQHGGEFPGTSNELIQLPGIGSYTAAAIASIAFGERVPVLDGNVKRVLSRWESVPESIVGEKQMPALAMDQLAGVSQGRYGDWNEAMMELGATVCVPGTPGCPRCPVRSECRGLKTGGEEFVNRIPEKKVKEYRILDVDCYILFDSGGNLKTTNEPDSYFFKAQNSLPISIREGEKVLYKNRLLTPATTGKSIDLGRFKHTITNHKLNVRVFALPGKSESKRINPMNGEKDRDRIPNGLHSSFARKAMDLYKAHMDA